MLSPSILPVLSTIADAVSSQEVSIPSIRTGRLNMEQKQNFIIFSTHFWFYNHLYLPFSSYTQRSSMPAKYWLGIRSVFKNSVQNSMHFVILHHSKRAQYEMSKPLSIVLTLSSHCFQSTKTYNLKSNGENDFECIMYIEQTHSLVEQRL